MLRAAAIDGGGGQSSKGSGPWRSPGDGELTFSSALSAVTHARSTSRVSSTRPGRQRCGQSASARRAPAARFRPVDPGSSRPSAEGSPRPGLTPEGEGAPRRPGRGRSGANAAAALGVVLAAGEPRGGRARAGLGRAGHARRGRICTTTGSSSCSRACVAAAAAQGGGGEPGIRTEEFAELPDRRAIRSLAVEGWRENSDRGVPAGSVGSSKPPTDAELAITPSARDRSHDSSDRAQLFRVAQHRRSHTRSIYRKLGVHEADAVPRRGLDLLG
jgi:hypothetical protein